MTVNRRRFVHLSGGVLAGVLLPAWARQANQRTVETPPKASSSHHPFGAYFTDIARQAGLVMPVLYRQVDHKDYILETVGCGCAFFDYDNDGWMDIFILNGNRLRGVPQGTTSRLYRNNRATAPSLTLPKSGLGAAGWASACVGR
jgi:hypothetical protein